MRRERVVNVQKRRVQPVARCWTGASIPSSVTFTICMARSSLMERLFGCVPPRAQNAGRLLTA